MLKAISTFLLIMLGVVLMPAELLHECTQHHSEAEHPVDSQEEEGECFICEFDFAPFVGVALAPISVEDPLTEILLVSGESNLKSSFAILPVDRGPPTS